MKNRFKVEYVIATKKQTSYLNLLDLTTQENKCLQPVKKLGAGTYGSVRLFAKEKTLAAVKMLHGEGKLTKSERRSEMEKIQEEFDFFQTAYPQLSPYSLHCYADSYRMVMPFIKGERIDGCLNDIVKPIELARLFLRVAQELHRIHELDIIHGDVSARNIIVERQADDFNVTFIDFGLAYSRNSFASTGFEYSKEMAPERLLSDEEREDSQESEENQKLKAHPNQDVYSLAKAMTLLKTEVLQVLDRETLLDQFPAILQFMQKGTATEPSLRPSLKSFIRDLQIELINMQLPENIAILAKYILKQDYAFFKAAYAWQEREYVGKPLFKLIHCLIKEGCADAVMFLLNFSKNIPIYLSNNVNNLFHLLAAQDNPALLGCCLDYLSLRKQAQVLNAANSEGDTPLHIAAKRGQVNIVLILLSYGANPSLKNLDELSVVDVGHEKVKSVLELAMLVHLSENRRLMLTSEACKTLSWMLEKILNPAQTQTVDNASLTVIEKNPKLKTLYAQLVKEGFLPDSLQHSLQTSDDLKTSCLFF